MQLTVNSMGIAEVQAHMVSLRWLLGSYELSFYLSGNIHPQQEQHPRLLVLHGAHVVAKAKSGQADLPYATVEQPVLIRQGL